MIITKESATDLYKEFDEYCQGRACLNCKFKRPDDEIVECFVLFLGDKCDEDEQETTIVCPQNKTQDNILFTPVQSWEFNCIEDIIGHPIKILDSDLDCDETFIYGIVQDFGTEYMTIQFDGYIKKFHVLKLMKLKPKVLDFDF